MWVYRSNQSLMTHPNETVSSSLALLSLMLHNLIEQQGSGVKSSVEWGTIATIHLSNGSEGEPKRSEGELEGSAFAKNSLLLGTPPAPSNDS